jgi:flagellar hook-associated protein 1 FlgK
MLGLFGTLNLGARSLQTQQQGIETSGHNLANVNNPAYARQRINIQTADTIPSTLGPVGTGAYVVRIQQLRDALLDHQVTAETSVRSFLDAKQAALDYGQALMGQEIDRQAAGAEGAAAAQGTGGQHGIADYLSTFFASLQSLATNPTSLTERQAVLAKAQDLAGRFNQIDTGLGNLQTSLNASIDTDIKSANELLASIADLNKQIVTAEAGIPGAANDLRDLRQGKIEQLAAFVNVQTTEQANGAVDISISGNSIVEGVQVVDTLESYDAGAGQRMVHTATSGTPLTLTSGSIQGVIDARDGALQSFRDDLDNTAAQLIAEVNGIYQSGFSLTGSTGANFFDGTDAASIQVNNVLAGDPSLLQASGVAGAVGDNQVALALAQLANKKIAALSGQTFSQGFSKAVADLGQALSSVNSDISDQNLVQNMLLRQRDSVSGVSLDEEMTEMMKFQKAYEASAHLITTIDEMLDTVLAMKR